MSVTVLRQPAHIAAGNPMIYQLKSNLAGKQIRFGCRIYVQEGTRLSLISTLEKPADASKQAFFDVSAFLWDQLNPVKPIRSYSGPIKCAGMALKYALDLFDFDENNNIFYQETYLQSTTSTGWVDLNVPLVKGNSYKIVAIPEKTGLPFGNSIFSDGTNSQSVIHAWIDNKDGSYETTFTHSLTNVNDITRIHIASQVKFYFYTNPPMVQPIIDKYATKSRFNDWDFAFLVNASSRGALLPSGTYMLNRNINDTYLYRDHSTQPFAYEHLYFYFRQMLAGSNDVIIRKYATDLDGNQEQVDSTTFTLEPENVYQYGVTPRAFTTDTIPLDRLKSITLQIVSGGKSLLNRSWKLRDYSGDYRQMFIYLTEFGGYETVFALGQASGELEVNRNESRHHKPVNYSYQFAETRMHSLQPNETHKVWMGYRSRAEYDILKELLYSREVYLFDLRWYIPLRILNKKVPSYSDANPLNSFELEYKFALNRI